jgi:predicted AAA+ superfamily ATPase
MWIQRYYENKSDFLLKGKVNILYGPRRAGKYSLVEKLVSGIPGKAFYGNGDDIKLQILLGSQDQTRILTSFQDYELIFIDEAQQIKNIGWGLKILIDNMPEALIIATGSSSFRLSSQVGEPLTGRHISNVLFPISILELKQNFGGMHLIQHLENYLIYGMYPEVLVINNRKQKLDYLVQLTNSYLLKDVLELDQIRNSDQLFHLLKLIAFQIGKDVSHSELANSLDISKHTVKRYLDILEKAFVIKRIGAFSSNLRKEITKSNRYYFFDNGIRNAIISNFNPIDQRNDIGQLWENFMVMERLKKQHYDKIYCNNYFWRTYDQKEVDLIEEREGKLFGFEFKWKARNQKIQKTFLETYPNSSIKIINNENFLKFVG